MNKNIYISEMYFNDLTVRVQKKTEEGNKFHEEIVLR